MDITIRITYNFKWEGIRSLAQGAALMLVFCAPVDAASVLSVGNRTVQSLVVDQLFVRSGRWYLLDDGGICYAYLQSPHTRLAAGRLFLDGHLVSRLGQRIGSECAGADFASDVTLSGQLRGAGSKLTLDDIRIERVQDEATRGALNLALQLAPQAMPRSLSIDILELVRGQEARRQGLAVRVDQFRILNLATGPDVITVQFELNLSAP